MGPKFAPAAGSWLDAAGHRITETEREAAESRIIRATLTSKRNQMSRRGQLTEELELWIAHKWVEQGPVTTLPRWIRQALRP